MSQKIQKGWTLSDLGWFSFWLLAGIILAITKGYAKQNFLVSLICFVIAGVPLYVNLIGDTK